MNKHQHRYRRGQLIRGAFEILQEHPDGISVRALLEEMRKRYPPLPGERETINENLSRYEASIHFMSIGAVKAGWFVKQKGKWYITEQGRQAFTEITDPEEFVQQIDKLYRDWYRHARSTQENNTEKVQSHIVLEQAEEAAKQDIIAYLTDQLNPYQFQELIAGLLQAIGYHVIWIAPPGPDGGIDIIAYTDPLGLQGPRIKVQVKNRNDKVTAKDIRQFLALLGEGDVGLFVSTGGFTRDAEDEARRQEKRRITLLDAEKFFNLWVEYYCRIPEQAQRLLPIRPVYFRLPTIE